MSRSLRVPWDEALTTYNFGPSHPLAPIRVELTMALSRAMGVLDLPGVSLEGIEPATDELLSLTRPQADARHISRASAY